MKRDALTARGALELWGLRLAGGALTDPTTTSTGGDRGEDFEESVVRFVESVPGFRASKPYLCHVYVRHYPPERFAFRKPGESEEDALKRWPYSVFAKEAIKGRMMELSVGLAMERRFVEALDAALIERPLTPAPILHDEPSFVTDSEREQYLELQRRKAV